MGEEVEYLNVKGEDELVDNFYVSRRWTNSYFLVMRTFSLLLVLKSSFPSSMLRSSSSLSRRMRRANSLMWRRTNSHR